MSDKGLRKSIGKEAALKLYETGWWENLTPHEICNVQLFTAELCCPFDVFYQSVEESLGRPVWTHEFGLNYDGIVSEFLGEKNAPTLREIIDLIPEEKRVVVVLDADA